MPLQIHDDWRAPGKTKEDFLIVAEGEDKTAQTVIAVVVTVLIALAFYLVFLGLTVEVEKKPLVISEIVLPPREITVLHYQLEANEAAKRNKVPRLLFLAVIDIESGWDINAHSNADAYGPAQLIKPTAEFVGVERYDWRENLEGGARYLRYLRNLLGSWPRAIYSYNGKGEAARKYQAKVLQRWEERRAE